MVQAPWATADLVLLDAAGCLVALVLRPAAQASLLPCFTPWICAAICTTGALLPLQFCRQPEAGPLAVSLGIIPVHADHRMHGFLGGGNSDLPIRACHDPPRSVPDDQSPR